MSFINNGIIQNKEERKFFRKAPLFAPAGQSTQLIIGATPDSDKQILSLASGLYNNNRLKRVYYSGYNPTNLYDSRLPAIDAPPLKRENRLYQADWLMRFYQFRVDEIVNDRNPDLDLVIDPKLAYALRNPHLFPIDVNRADYHMLLRIPGVGPKSAKMILAARQFRKLNSENLRKIGVVMKRAQFFITCNELPGATVIELQPERVRSLLTMDLRKQNPSDARQLSLW